MRLQMFVNRISPFFFLAAALLSPLTSRADTHCHVAAAHEPTPAEKAFLDGKAGEAEKLYREALDKAPHDAALTAGLVRTLLREQKVDDAEAALRTELTAAPNSVVLLTALAEVQYRQGKVADAAGTADQAFHADPCNARLYLVRSRILHLNSMYASEQRAIGLAHQLDPYDIDIRGAWVRTLPLAQKVGQQKQYMAANTGMDAEERSRTEKYLAFLEGRTDSPEKTCHVVSTAASTDTQFIPLMSDGSGRHIEGWGIHVFINNKEAQLEVDTGASGLLINRAVAERAGLKSIGRVEIGGVGDQGAQGGFVALVDSIRVGGFEFHDCIVRVTDRKDMLNIDGLIGADVFGNYLITLDYPMRKFSLSQLPPRPDESGTVVTLNTEAADQAGSSTAANSGPHDRFTGPSMKDYTPFFRSGHMIILPTLLNGKVLRLFLLDSGAFSSSISPEAAREVTKVHGNSPFTIRGLSGNVAKVSSGDQVLFTFGGIQQTNNNLFAFDTTGLSRYAGVEVSGFLGNTVLRELTTRIDYRDGLVKFDYDLRHGNHDFSH
jgi:Aspartyl protease/Tetratricopeptide repeat